MQKCEVLNAYNSRRIGGAINSSIIVNVVVYTILHLIQIIVIILILNDVNYNFKLIQEKDKKF